MSLDVWLEVEEPVEVNTGSGIFVREAGQIKEISRQEWDDKFPDIEPYVVPVKKESNVVYGDNITHNLNTMAGKAGIYKHLWRPDEIGIETAGQLIEPLEQGLNALRSNPDYYKKYNPDNGWGNYEGLVRFVANYLTACKKHPNARIRISR